jgi:hypothetical protein
MTPTKKISATFRVLPPGVPSRVWLVLRTTGEHYFMHKPPLEGWAL